MSNRWVAIPAENIVAGLLVYCRTTSSEALDIKGLLPSPALSGGCRTNKNGRKTGHFQNLGRSRQPAVSRWP
jgi:hypothetical protein